MLCSGSVERESNFFSFVHYNSFFVSLTVYIICTFLRNTKLTLIFLNNYRLCCPSYRCFLRFRQSRLSRRGQESLDTKCFLLPLKAQLRVFSYNTSRICDKSTLTLMIYMALPPNCLLGTDQNCNPFISTGCVLYGYCSL